MPSIIQKFKKTIPHVRIGKGIKTRYLFDADKLQAWANKQDKPLLRTYGKKKKGKKNKKITVKTVAPKNKPSLDLNKIISDMVVSQLEKVKKSIDEQIKQLRGGL